ncbi:MAG: molybdopterin-guanine dinucleotide biosynthesis protein MobA [Phormidesmis priestleyi Ana]|uniref:Molybdopterin-guanine dinucleotide biosynthesis protein MobA n=1 Tax=Phormidesmis priestleyi Ana TaxID=1666911 RepID=A0A0P7ZXT0_9CYAN|nr:MAG: molybdopterin-guanine dinucleotide biosynthesis protein MobA [Phormidesmis priestleyi Ana]
MILAGGHSRRMGQDKALLKLPDGQQLLSRTAQIAQQLTADVVVVTPWPDRYRTMLPPSIRWVTESPMPPQSPSLQKPRYLGPVSGFAQGWAQIESEWCLLLACDLPYLQSEPLQQWWAWLEKREKNRCHEVAAVAKRYPMASLVAREETKETKEIRGTQETTWEPLCGFYHRSCLPALTRHIRAYQAATDGAIDARPQESARQPSTAKLSFQTWLKPLPVLAYTALPPQLLFNCNTPQDWASIKTHFE